MNVLGSYAVCSSPAEKEKSIDDIDTTKSVSELTGEDMRTIAMAYNRSDIVQVADRLDYVLDRNQNLSRWEVERLTKVFEKFAAKYKSPLAEALK